MRFYSAGTADAGIVATAGCREMAKKIGLGRKPGARKSEPAPAANGRKRKTDAPE